MGLRNLGILLILFLMALSFMGCKSGGIEVGNPNLSTTTTNIVPASGNENYQVTLLDGNQALVVQLEKNSTGPALLTRGPLLQTIGQNNIILSSVTVTYTQNNNQISFSATFPNGTTIVVTLNLNANGAVTGGSILINGQAVAATFTSTAVPASLNVNQSLSNGQNAWINHDIDVAESTYCNAFTFDPTNSQLAFGCFWAKLLKLGETTEATALLSAFNQPMFDVNQSLLDGPNGLFPNNGNILTENCFGFLPPGDPACDLKRWPLFNYTDFNLPFSGFFSTHSLSSNDVIYGNLLDLAITQQISASDLQDLTFDLRPHFTQMEFLLGVVLADSSFSFILPAQLFSITNNVNVTLTDAQLFMAGIQSSINAIDVGVSYDMGVEIDVFVQNGVVDQQILTEDLNGSGATVNGVTVDTVSFLTLIDPTRISNTRSRMLSSLQLLRGGLISLNSGTPSDFFYKSTSDYNLPNGISEVNAWINSINNGPVNVNYGGRAITLNINQFLNNPFDAASLPITAGDPFVFQNNETTGVENYFRQLLQGIANF